MPSLGESSYCEVCGRAYRTSDGHNCVGSRRAQTPGTQTAAATSHAATAASPSRSTGRNQR